MRIAVFSDVHGNSIALDAVLADIAADGGADGYWVLGDLVAIGADPVGILERLAALPNAVFVQGNTERYVLTGERPYPSIEDVLADPALLPRLVEVAHSFAWTQGAITAAGWFDWLANLPLEQRLTLPDGTRVLLVHVAPGTVDGAGIHPALPDERLRPMLEGCEADTIAPRRLRRCIARITRRAASSWTGYRAPAPRGETVPPAASGPVSRRQPPSC